MEQCEVHKKEIRVIQDKEVEVGVKEVEVGRKQKRRRRSQ